MNFIKLLNSRKLFIFIFFFLSLSILFSQKRKDDEGKSKKPPIYFETHVVPNDSLFTCFVSFKIPFNHLLFVRENGNYKSELFITYEIFENTKFISRVYDKKTVAILEYEKTNDSKLFLEGITSFKIEKGEYRILPSIQLANTDIEIKNKPIKLLVDSTQISRPIVVSKRAICDSLSMRLTNIQNSIPFSNHRFDLLIPIYSENDLFINVEIKQNDKTIINKKINEFILFSNELSECNNQIILTKKNNLALTKYFKLNYVNKNLVEGDVKIFIESATTDFEYDLNVFWSYKPKSLFDIEEAIESMIFIGYKNVADSLLDLDENEQYKALFDYWSKFDDDNSTSFNEVFNEYYSRIDFVKEEFNSLGKNDGLDTDRGKTYLLFGKPDKIERTYSEVYNVLEVWIYSSLNEKIYFSDKTGTGKFERIK